MASDFTRPSTARQAPPQNQIYSQNSAHAEPKLSRYRSVRRSQHQQQLNLNQQSAPPLPAVPQPPPTATSLPPAKRAQQSYPTPSGLSRTMSRYRRDRPATAGGAEGGGGGLQHHALTPPVPPIPTTANGQSQSTRQRATSSPQSRQQQAAQFQQQQQQRQLEQLKLSAKQQLEKERQQSSSPARRRYKNQDLAQMATTTTPTVAAPTPPGVKPLTKSTNNQRTNRPQRSATAKEVLSPRQEAQWVLDSEAERQRRMKAQIRAEKKARLEAEERERAAKEEEERLERERLDEEKRELERIERETREAEERERLEKLREREKQKEKERMRREEERRRRHKEKQEQGETRRREKEEQGETRRKEKEELRQEAALQRSNDTGGMLGLFKKKDASKPAPPAFHTIGGIIAGGGNVAGADAPISAVNAGDRRVTVECNNSSISLPVSQTTTPVDLIRSAATCLSEQIDVSRSVLIESFTKAGVQRPLRRYEHVRHVLNSWDDDTQNALVLYNEISNADQELSASAVPQERPGEVSFTMHYSQRPGKWNKRFFVLQPDGQMLQTKNETNKEFTKVCHLSDFDIYTPTAKSASRKIKPPRKICFAVKSQQKSSMFEASNNFVHFFCTGDRDTGSAFYKAVQGWRSWYLVNVMGEGQKKMKASDELARPTSSEKKSGGLLGHHKAAASVDSHYQLGSFKPLLDLDDFSCEMDASLAPLISIGEHPQHAARAMHSRKLSSRTRAPPPISYNSRTSRDIEPPSSARPSMSEEEGTFAPTSLLGRSYSQRQRIQRERDAAAKASGPFTDGPSLLSYGEDPTTRGGLGRTTSTRRPSADLSRSPSNARRQMQMPKPLVDLTPAYQEPPQHARKGKGFNPDTIGPGGLVDCATSPEMAFHIPPSTDWRRPPTSGGGGPQPALADRTRSMRASGARLAAAATNINPHAVPESSADAFTGRGLMGTDAATSGFGAQTTGHGVMSGANATGPMLDLREASRFAKGSLLSRVEREQAPVGPMIDREKRMTVEVGTGEGQ